MGAFLRFGIGIAITAVFFVFFASGGHCNAAASQEPPAAQEQRGAASTQGSVPDYSLSGMVVDTTTGQGVGHALVELSIYAQAGAANPPAVRKVMSDEDGRFEIRGLTVTGRAGIEASKPGYRTAQQVRMGFAKSLAAFQELTIEPNSSVTVKLTPEGTIAGRVVDESGEPIEGLPVHLTFEAAVDGRRTLEENGESPETDQEGEFRFAELPSGRYYVAAGPSREVSSQKTEKGRTSLGYAVTFYGGGSDAATASAINLTAGKSVDVDLRMELQPLLKVMGFTSGSAPGRPATITIFNAANQRVADLSPSNPEREFLLAELPPGWYTIHATSIDNEGSGCVATLKRLKLTRDVTGLQLALTPCATTTVNVHADHTKPESTKKSYVLDEEGGVHVNLRYLAQVRLQPKDERGKLPTYFGRPNADNLDKTVVRGVEPGRYKIEVAMVRGVYIESMQAGMTDLLREDLVVEPGASVAPIEIRVRDDAATLTGKVKLDPGVTAAAVIAIPEGMPKGAKTTIVNSGRFQFPPLAPGRYEVLAVDRVDDFAYAEQDVIGKYLGRAKEVTLRANEQTTVDLEFVRVGLEEQQ